MDLLSRSGVLPLLYQSEKEKESTGRHVTRLPVLYDVFVAQTKRGRDIVFTGKKEEEGQHLYFLKREGMRDELEEG